MKILVATDGSDLSRRAIDSAVRLAKALGGTVVGCSATPTYKYHGFGGAALETESRFQTQVAAEANEHLAAVETAASAAGVPCELVIREGAAERVILQTASDHDCDLIVMASHGRGGVSSLLLGSETQKVLAFANRPVLVVR